MPDQQPPDSADNTQQTLLAEVTGGADAGTDGQAPPEDAVEELRAVAEDLRAERERLEWTAAQVAHLVEQRPTGQSPGPSPGPSFDPDPTPPAPIDVQPPAAVGADGEAGARLTAADGSPPAPATATAEADAPPTTDPDQHDDLPAPQRRGGGLVTVLGALLLLLAAAVLVSRVMA